MGPECGNAKLGGMINTTQFGTSQPTSNGHHTNINANMNHPAITVVVAIARGRGKGKASKKPPPLLNGSLTCVWQRQILLQALPGVLTGNNKLVVSPG